MLLPFLLLVMGILSSIYFFFIKDRILKQNEDMASDVLFDNLKDPLITSRAYFTEPEVGSIGNFVGYSPMSKDDWLHSFSHEEPQDERSKYNKIRSLV